MLKPARTAAEKALTDRLQRQATQPFADTSAEDRRLQAAQQQLRAIIEEYTDTEAAAEAERLLGSQRAATIPCPPYREMPHARVPPQANDSARKTAE
jgi:hypothetical protein